MSATRFATQDCQRLALAKVRLARGRTRYLRAADGNVARAAAVGCALCALRWRRRRRSRRGVARHRRWRRQGAAGETFVAGSQGRRQVVAGRRTQARAAGNPPAASVSIPRRCAKYRPNSRSDQRASIGSSRTRDPRVDVGKGGEARAIVGLAGDEDGPARVDTSSYPRTGNAPNASARVVLRVAKMGIGLLVVIIGVAALIAAIVAWSRGQFRSPRLLAYQPVCGCALVVGGRQSMARDGDVRSRRRSRTLGRSLLWAGGTALSLLLFTLLIGLFAGVAAWAAASQVRPGRRPRSR